MYKNSRGFTIVELLIVIVVIGILAAIVIVAFNGIQARANAAAVKSDLTTFSKKMEHFKIDAVTGRYPNTIADLNGLGMKITSNAYRTGSGFVNLLYCQSGSNTNYALLATTKNNGRYYISNIEGTVQEYTGPINWDTDTITNRCQSILPSGYNTAEAGYNSAWRQWTGV